MRCGEGGRGGGEADLLVRLCKERGEGGSLGRRGGECALFEGAFGAWVGGGRDAFGNGLRHVGVDFEELAKTMGNVYPICECRMAKR